MVDGARAPVIIGITGKRDLNGKIEAVRLALCQAFDQLDSRFPSTPKILLTALAEGTDTIAAEEVLVRPAWRIVASLPFSVDLYLQDFDEAPAARFRRLIENPKVETFILDPLVDSRSGQSFEPSALNRQANGSNESRTLHYEQAGLFIAEHCAVLIAVLPANEQPGRIGGTARVVNYRLRGKPDSIACNVLQDSRILRKALPLDRPHTGPVWQIDLSTAQSHPAGIPNQLEVRLPEADRPSFPLSHEQSLGKSLRLISRIDAFNRRIPQEVINQLGKAVPTDATSVLRRLRLMISAIQIQTNRRVRLLIYSLAILFVFAITALELYAEFSIQIAIFLYVCFLFLALSLYYFAQRNAWQTVAEDYRAVAEALRVQIVWWESGLVGPEYRVDRFYLRGVMGSLGLVRAALCHIIDAAYLGSPIPASVPNSETRWIQHQISFFENRILLRRTRFSIVEASSWFLLMMAMGPPVFLAALEIDSKGIIDSVMHKVWNYLPPGSLVLGVIVVTITLLSISISHWAHSMVRLGNQRGRMLNLNRMLLAISVGLLAGIGLYDLAAWLEPELTKRVSKELALIATIVPAAAAGALRFIPDKLSWEAEVNGYEETLEIFRRAEADLSELVSVPPSSARTLRNRIILELGKEALDENESWIRSHRERPLEPLVGG